MQKIRFIVIPIILILCACGVEQKISNTQVQGKDTGNAELNSVIVSYFTNFDDISNWSSFATDDFIKRAYYWCTGDDSESKTLEEMKSIYYDINKNSLKLKNYMVNDIETENENAVIIHVSRVWEDGSEDVTSYSLIKIRDNWKIDNRF